ncbi:MAG: DUF2161 family putative PD-(D/E)XK-type phosphodiesterase [Clostridia bacterium]|nr:DUF2161 family putative PD-(D/E)XK-type phosphodiesterase [Clostridia bacterium]
MAEKQKNKIREEDLYKPVYEYLTEQGYTVNSEVNDCDVTAIKDEQLIIVELKKSLNLELLIQAVKRQKLADGVYVAVPHPGKSIFSSRWKDVCHLVRRLELGLMLVSLATKSSQVRIEFHPTEFDRQHSKRLNKKKRYGLIEEIRERHGDYNTGGSTRKKLVTAYKEKAIQIACAIDLYGQLKPKQLKLLGTDEKKTSAILLKNHYGWFKRLGNGFYGLSEAGIQALKEHEQLTSLFKVELLENRKENEDKA